MMRHDPVLFYVRTCRFCLGNKNGNDKTSLIIYCEVLDFEISPCFSTFLDRGKWCEFSVVRFSFVRFQTEADTKVKHKANIQLRP